MKRRSVWVAMMVAGVLVGAFGAPLANLGFEEPMVDGTVPGWTWSCDDSVAKVSVVAGVGVGGSKALLIEKRSSEKEFVARQRIRLTPGGHYRVTCRIRTADFRCADLNLDGADHRRVQGPPGAPWLVRQRRVQPSVPRSARRPQPPGQVARPAPRHVGSPHGAARFALVPRLPRRVGRGSVSRLWQTEGSGADALPQISVVDVSSPDLKVRTWEVGGRSVALVVNGAYRPVSGTVRCAGRAPLDVRLGALAHGYHVLQK